MPLNDASVQLNVRGTLSTALDLKSVVSSLAYGKSIAWQNGTGANQADKVWDDIRTIAPSANDDLDLAGVLLDAFGVAITFARVKAIIVVADPANTNNVVIGAAAATVFQGPFGAATHTIAVPPGGMFAIARADATAWPVGAGATDLLRIANGGAGTSVTYSIVVIGASA